MALETVPWFIDQNAHHSADVARLLAYVAFRGEQGIVSPLDFAVTALNTPGGSVNIAPGAGSVLNRALGKGQQSYAIRGISTENVAVTPTTGAIRSDLVVLRIENPYLSGEPWANPPDLINGPYLYARVISNVPNTTTTLKQVDSTMSGIALARIDIPVSTSAITNAMIVDLRKMVSALQTTDELFTACDNNQILTAATTTYTQFPNQCDYNVFVPEWATHLQINAICDPAVVLNGATHGIHTNWRWSINSGAITTTPTDLDINSPGVATGQGDYRCTKPYSTSVTLTPAMRGTTINVKPQMAHNKTFVNHTDDLKASRGTSMAVEFVWKQKPVGA